MGHTKADIVLADLPFVFGVAVYTQITIKAHPAQTTRKISIY